MRQAICLKQKHLNFIYKRLVDIVSANNNQNRVTQATIYKTQNLKKKSKTYYG